MNNLRNTKSKSNKSYFLISYTREYLNLDI